MDMADKFKLAKNLIDEAAPRAIVGVKEIKDRDIISIADVHRLDHGEGCRLRVVRKRSDAGVRATPADGVNSIPYIKLLGVE
jgi:hypothetical protein